MKGVLLTGFSNFGNAKNNPSEELVNLLDRQVNGLNTYIFRGYKDIDENLHDVLNKFRPDTIIMFGQANKTPFVRLERFAKRTKNLEGKTKYESKLPLDKIYKQLTAQGIETQYSDDAGNYWCNYLFYKVSLLMDDSNALFGLIHIPKPGDYKKTYGNNLDMLSLGRTIINSVED